MADFQNNPRIKKFPSRNRSKKETKKIGPSSHNGGDLINIHPDLLDASNGSLFFNRELSWLEFNFRVLEEAAREDNPLLERIKFLAISESNLDEFFMVRVAGLKQVVASSIKEIQMDGRTPQETLEAISVKVHSMVQLQYRLLNEITNGLAKSGIVILDHYDRMEEHEREFIREFFNNELFPVLTPMAVDPSHPFPHIANGRLNQALVLQRTSGKDQNKEMYAFVEVPSVFPRLLELPRKESTGNRRFLPLEEVLKLHASDLFSGTIVKSMHGFSITRNSDLSIDEVASDNLLSTIEEELKNRMWGEAVRLNYRAGMPDSVREFLREQLDLVEDELYERPGLLNLHDLMVVYNVCKDRYPDLVDFPFIPKNIISQGRTERIFERIKKHDLLLHHPYDSFQTVVDLLEYASQDPNVLAIKQTLYRTSGDSPIVRSLIEAAENGKQVTVLVELKARFDEENNIVWARQMEKHGIHVVYGLLGLKIHGKMLQIIRKEGEDVRSYVHLSTGNYNPNTSKVYTDLSLLTVHQEINQDVTRLFHSLTGYATSTNLTSIVAAPINLRESLRDLITNEMENAKHGKPAGIRLKLNALVDAEMILLLYRCSMAGISVELNVRGICCLRPGIKGLSENIRVTSIVGRFLEHSRIFYFENGGDPLFYLSSADWMPRNLNRRVEIMFPVMDPHLKERLVAVLNVHARDNHNARLLNQDGTYTMIQPASEDARFSAQRYFREEANKEFEQKEMDRVVQRKMVFHPVTNPEAIESNKSRQHTPSPGRNMENQGAS